MHFKALETEQKLRGGYYTPLPIAELLCQWVLARGARSILEPGCGDGVFLRALSIQAARITPSPRLSIEAVEIVEEEAARAELHGAQLRAAGMDARIIRHDVFRWLCDGQAGRTWDAIIGNPPYIRYQYFEREQRDLAEQLFRRANVPFTKRTNAWVPLVIASIMHLNAGGCLALVLPAELLHIHHASGLRRLLEQEMETVTLIHIREMVFPGVLQGVVLLLASKRRGRGFRPLAPSAEKSAPELEDGGELEEPARVQICDLDSLADLSALLVDQRAAVPPGRLNDTHGEWMLGLLSDEEMALVRALQARQAVLPFATIASVDIGIVTGANDFFVVDEDTLARFGLKAIAAPMLAKSELIKGITYTAFDHEANARAGKSVYFLVFPASSQADLPPGVAAYISLGEAQRLHERYKCRIREPWYVVPYTWTTEMALLKRCHRFPRLVVNELRAHSTDTAYRVRLQAGYEDRAQDLTCSFLNSLTFLGAELGGRHYGGGVLELVPSEIEQLLIPLQTVDAATFARVDAMIRANATLDELLDFTDPRILGQGLHLSPEEIQIMRAAHRRLLKRRLRL